MKSLLLTVALLALSGPTIAATPSTPQHRYVIERTFPKGALDHLDANTKDSVNRTNARFGVHWIMSYANADMTKTYCIYEGPSEKAIREAAKANKMSVDSIAEVPVTLDARVTLDAI